MTHHHPSSQQNSSILKVWNTLTKSKSPLNNPNNKFLSWYNCGPTVYDSAHLGHARNYLTFDIIRRILEDYLGYHVTYVMNITDIDDKIIIKARNQYNIKKYKHENPTINEKLKKDLQEILNGWTMKKLNVNLEKLSINSHSSTSTPITTIPSASSLSLSNQNDKEDKSDNNEMNNSNQKQPKDSNKNEKDELLEIKAKKTLLTNQILKANSILVNAPIGSSSFSLIDALEDPLASHLDSLGPSINDHAIFRELSSFWEKDFFNDMNRLNIRPPNLLTRATDFIPQVVTFVEKIVSKELAYVLSDGSVYFNVGEFEKRGHDYAKLCPHHAGNPQYLEESEGALGVQLGKGIEGESSEGGGEGKMKRTSKIDPRDFCLWKASKRGEPFWQSPWGNGRPGWHIECSTMSEAIFGDHLDIHSGGIDLAFPHHDNEIAQAEAHSGKHSWALNFWHAGHLHMEGLKMSKSLKNFITIKDALEKWSPKELRMFILMHSWSSSITFHEERSLREAASILSKFFVFIDTAQALILVANRDTSIPPTNIFDKNKNSDTNSSFNDNGSLTMVKPLNWRQEERNLQSHLNQIKESVHEAILDSFDTPHVISLLSDLVSKANIYIKDHENINQFVLTNVVDYLIRMMNIFGFELNLQSKEGSGENANAKGKNIKEDSEKKNQLQSVMTLLNDFRDGVRNAAAKKDTSTLFTQCDEIRNKLSDLGIVIEDRSIGKPSIIRFSSL